MRVMGKLKRVFAVVLAAALPYRATAVICPACESKETGDRPLSPDMIFMITE